jgi:hypothetical protein
MAIILGEIARGGFGGNMQDYSASNELRCECSRDYRVRREKRRGYECVDLHYNWCRKLFTPYMCVQ